MKSGRIGAAIAVAAMVGVAQSAFAGEPVPGNHVHLVVERVADDLNPLAAFFVMCEVVLPAEAGVTQVTLTDPLGTEIDLEDEDPGAWGAELEYADFTSMKGATDGLWTIEIEGAAPSTSEFTIDLDSLVEGDLFSTPVVKAPTSGASGVGADVEFLWSTPTGSKKKPEFIRVEVQATAGGSWQDDDNFMGGALTIASTTWNPPSDLEDGENEFALLYLRRDDSGRSSALTVTSGTIAWGSSPFAAEGYPAGTPLVAMGSERIILFTVGTPCPADLDSNGTVGFADLVSALTTWGPCIGCPADIDANGAVGFSDLVTILTSWGPCKG